jgi:hypothetical protein
MRFNDADLTVEQGAMLVEWYQHSDGTTSARFVVPPPS